MKKVLCLLLCMVMLLGVLVSCGGDETDGGEQGGTTAGSGEGNATVDPNGTTAGNIPGGTTGGGNTPTRPNVTQVAKYGKHTNIDFGGRSFNVMARENRFTWFHGDANTTDDVTKAAYQRNMKLNSMYNITISVIPATDKADWNTKLAASSGEYDLAMPDYWWGLEYAGHFENIMQIPEINDQDEYWVQGWNDNLIINNRLYTIVGDASLEIMENIEVVFYNKDIEDEYGYNLYQDVQDDKWTLDYVLEINENFVDFFQDDDTSNDLYGIGYDQHSIVAQMYSAGVTLLQTNRNNGVIRVIANTQRNVDVTDKIGELANDPATLYQGVTARNAKTDLFTGGQMFMFAGWLYGGKAFKNAGLEWDYGILVMPKYNEGDDYRATSYGVSTMAIPVTAKDAQMTACILDTMTWLSNTEDEGGMGNDRLVYAYYNTVVKGQITNSPQDNAMMDLARNTAYYDFGFIVNADVGIESSFLSAMREGTSVSTKMDAIIQKANSGLTSMIEFYNK